MSKLISQVRRWLPVAASIGALALASVYALSREKVAAEGIREMNYLGTTLSDAAQQARDGTRSREELGRLVAEKNDLQKRMAESLEPSLVQAELMKSAKEAGLTLREIQPVKATPESRVAVPGYPRYRIRAGGNYQQIAEYLQLCSRQRLPARVVEFSVRPPPQEDAAQSGALAAEITVETFQPPAKGQKEEAPGGAKAGDGK